MSYIVNDLSKTYKGKKTEEVNALRGVSFTLHDTGMVFILGKSGCGKSTLLNLLGGLDSFDGGDIVVDGKSMKDFSAKDYDDYRNNYVGFVFQENNLLEQYTVKRNVGLALDLQSQKGVDEKIAEALDAVDLKDFGERRCNRLSGGQKQRVAIARAIIKKPSILLCDEPTGSLDSDTGKEIFELLKKVSQNTLVVVVSHDRESAEKYGDRVIEIKDGSLLSDSAPVSAETCNLRKTKKIRNSGLPAKRALGIGAGYLIARPVRLALCILICLITFTCIGIADTINSYDRGMAIFNTVEQMGINEYVFGREMIEKGRIYEYSSNYIRNMSKEDYGRLESRVKTKRLDKVYSFYRYDHNGIEISQLADTKDEYWFKIRGFTETDEQFFGDYGYTLYGRVPENYGEAVISLHTFKGFMKYSYGEPNPKWNSIFGNTSDRYINVEEINEYDDIIGKQIEVGIYTFTVVGIADTKMDNELYGDFLYKNKELTDDEESDFNHYFNEYIHNVLYLAQGFRDDVVLEDTIKEANKYGGDYTSDTVEDIKRTIAPYNGNRAEKIYNIRVFERHFSYEGNEDLWCFDTENLAVWNISSVDSTLNIFAEIFLYITIAASVISVLYVIYYTSGTIAEKSKEIGILRALGASQRDIIKLFCAENGLFAAGIIAVTTALSAVGAYVLNSAIATEYRIIATLISFGIRQFAVLAAVAIGAIVAGIAIPIIKLLRAKPVDIIAGRK